MSYIGQTLPADTFQGFTTDSFTGDGSATTFTLSKTPFNESALLVVINNVVQKPTTNFTVSGTTLTIVGTAVASNDVIYATHIGGALPIGQAASLDLNGASDQLILDADADTTISADTDDQIDFKAGGTDVMSMTATGLTINDGVTITTADNTDTLTLTSTDADASIGPNIVLNRDSSSPADNDIVGQFTFRADNDAGEATDYCRFRVHLDDVSNGTEDGNFRLFTLNGGAENSRIDIDKDETVFNEDSVDVDFRVESNGDQNCLRIKGDNDHVGIGTGSPGYKLTVHDTVADAVFQVKNASTSGNIYGQHILFGYAPDDNSNHFFYCSDTVANRFFILSDGDIIADGQSINSDERLKENIVDATTKWDDVKSLKVRNFNWTKAHHPNRQHKHIGFIAQEFETIFPSLVRETNLHPDPRYTQEDKDDGNIPDGKSVGDEKNVLNRKSIHTTALIPILTKTLQEAMAKIETLETKVKALEDA